MKVMMSGAVFALPELADEIHSKLPFCLLRKPPSSDDKDASSTPCARCSSPPASVSATLRPRRASRSGSSSCPDSASGGARRCVAQADTNVAGDEPPRERRAGRPTTTAHAAEGVTRRASASAMSAAAD